jgi:hypothetical protein
LRIYRITDEVFQFYRENVKDNENISRDQAERKLTRNILLSMPVPQRNGNQKWIYGNLHIIVNSNKVVRLLNHSEGKYYPMWFKDETRYNELTKQLGIK